jgi:hypothetical protein
LATFGTYKKNTFSKFLILNKKNSKSDIEDHSTKGPFSEINSTVNPLSMLHGELVIPP